MIKYQGEKRRLAIRKPSWLTNLQVNGTEKYHEDEEWLYFETIENLEVTLIFEQPVRTLFANPLISQDVNQVALQRGPFVYCLEAVDNGKQLWRCRVDPEKLAVEIEKTETIWQETVKLSVQGYQANLWQERELYRTVPEKLTPKKWQLIPYHLWGNRGEGEMRVWLPIK